ncbi:MAG: hypothetical protein HN396_04410 [Gemmatimonadales bacterium]|jgi:hypothetical protein|nr:hypothetical protein [Gemmatimonadales bacterium]
MPLRDFKHVKPRTQRIQRILGNPWELAAFAKARYYYWNRRGFPNTAWAWNLLARECRKEADEGSPSTTIIAWGDPDECLVPEEHVANITPKPHAIKRLWKALF